MIAFLLSCRDAELSPLHDALDAYERGHALLDDNHPAEAAEAFAEAARLDPKSPTLGLWEARARAAAGDLTAAESLATAVIEAHPDAGIAWYNRAAWRARLGHASAAASDLERALRLHVTSPYEAVLDPDFAAVAHDPAFANLLPPTPVVVQLTPPAGSVFLGSEVAVEVASYAAPSVVFSLRRVAPTPGCLSLDRIVEETHREPGLVARRDALYFRTRAPCSFALTMDLDVSAPVATRVAMAPVPVLVEAPAAFVAPAPTELPEALPIPAAYPIASAGWTTGRDEGWVWALGPAGDEPRFEGRPPDVKLEVREDDSTRAAGGAWAWAGGGTVRAGAFSAVISPKPGVSTP